LLGLAACAPAAAPAAPAAQGPAAEAPAAEPAAPATGGGTMRIAYNTDIVKLDPGIQQTGGDVAPTFLVYSRLVEFDNTMMQHMAGLAESWDQSEECLTYPFPGRQGVICHSGRELTAEHVVYTLERGFEIGPHGRFAGYMISVDSY